MATNQDTVAAFLARGGVVTQCGSTKKQARSLRAMRREDEQRAEAEANGSIDHEVAEREAGIRNRLEIMFG